MKKTIGITGGIGAGKSIIGRLLTSLGYPVFYSDQIAKEIMETDTELISGIKLIFGHESFLTSGKLNKPFLGNQIFQDKSKLEKMNKLVHPAVRKKFIDFAAQSSSNLVFNEAAVLFETNSYKKFDHVILVVADIDTRISRIIKRDRIDREKVLERINNQWSDEKKRALTPFIISNNKGELLTPQVLNILNQFTSS